MVSYLGDQLAVGDFPDQFVGSRPFLIIDMRAGKIVVQNSG
jgi:hypothetical protein